jgi:hypothetical protein
LVITKTRYNIPLYLFGLHVEGIPVDKNTRFKVKYLSGNSVVIAVDEYPNGFCFDKVMLEFAGTGMEALANDTNIVKEYEPFNLF